MRRAPALLFVLCALGCDGGSVLPSVPCYEADVASMIRESACFEIPLRPVRARGAYGEPPPNAQELEAQRCAIAATTCEDYVACLGVDLGAPCGIATSRCDGSRRVRCIDTRLGTGERTDDCAETVNPICRWNASRGAHCVRSVDCVGESVLCEGNSQVLCSLDGESVEIELPCGETRICLDGNCVISGEECLEDHCDGTNAIRCSGTLTVGDVIECARLIEGGVCEIRDGFADCVDPEPECNFEEASCDGNIARICGYGRWQELDCGSFGASCVADLGEASCVL